MGMSKRDDVGGSANAKGIHSMVTVKGKGSFHGPFYCPKVKLLMQWPDLDDRHGNRPERLTPRQRPRDGLCGASEHYGPPSAILLRSQSV